MAVVLYAAVGASIMCYRVDGGAASLACMGGTAVPTGVQYAWRHPFRPVLYVAFSDHAALHGVLALAIENDTGRLLPLADESSILFATMTRRTDHAVDSLPDLPVMRRWWVMMGDIMDTNPDGSPVVQPLPEMFRPA